MKEIVVQVKWNAESRAWLATSEEITGLVAESASYEELIEIVEDLLPDLLVGSDRASNKAIPYQLISHHTATYPIS